MNQLQISKEDSITKVSFELTWNDIHTAIANYVKDKGEKALDCDKDSLTQVFVSFEDRDGWQCKVETASVTFKKLM